MIRLTFGSVPKTVKVRLGTHSTLTSNPAIRPSRVSCVWDGRLRSRPRRLALALGAGLPLNPRMSSYHGRYLYA